MKQLLTLHEAIAVVLLSKENRMATTHELAEEIIKRGLFSLPSDTTPPWKRIWLRVHPSTRDGKTYSHLFSFTEPDLVQLRCSN